MEAVNYIHNRAVRSVGTLNQGLYSEYDLHDRCVYNKDSNGFWGLQFFTDNEHDNTPYILIHKYSFLYNPQYLYLKDTKPNKLMDIKVIALLTLLKDGGRTKPIENDYRPDHELESGILTMGHVSFVDEKRHDLKLGQSAEVYVTFILPESKKDKVFSLNQDSVWNIYEGSKIVGNCRFVTLC